MSEVVSISSVAQGSWISCGLRAIGQPAAEGCVKGEAYKEMFYLTGKRIPLNIEFNSSPYRNYKIMVLILAFDCFRRLHQCWHNVVKETMRTLEDRPMLRKAPLVATIFSHVAPQ
ncbi:hypothetical protein N4G62_13365 [Sphingomonas sanguinis]|uniref:Uncharacterized protein n=1 Tax=Sphingomonas sanguinis TaxID=33051 RepID=A0ABU5LSU6_9SPHN|nr:hypothetical protein [Sphingomonas sanguinis]MDZ7283014.1 hypothetical protein [Sphingomonas sanguinis]